MAPVLCPASLVAAEVAIVELAASICSTTCLRQLATTTISTQISRIRSREHYSIDQTLQCGKISSSRCAVHQSNGLNRDRTTVSTDYTLDLLLRFGCSTTNSSTK